MDREDVRALYMETLTTEVKRFGIEAFAKWIETKTDFFSAPCSCKGELAYEGALAERVMATYLQMEELLEGREEKMTESTTLVCLLTGLSRINTMQKDDTGKYSMIRNKKELPIGRCERGLYIAGRFLQLESSEIIALRWFDVEACKITETDELREYAKNDPKLEALVKAALPDAIVLQGYAAKKEPLVQMLQTAWILAADVASAAKK